MLDMDGHRTGTRAKQRFTAGSPRRSEWSSVDALVLVAGMVPAPGERPAEWWTNSRYRQAVEEQARRDGGLTGSDDPFVAFYHDVPRAIAEEAMRRERSESDAAYNSPTPRRTCSGSAGLPELFRPAFVQTLSISPRYAG